MIEPTPQQLASADLAAHIARQLNELWLKNFPLLPESKAEADAEAERRLDRSAKD